MRRLDCCTPFLVGSSWYHQTRGVCSVSPGSKLTPAEYSIWRARLYARQTKHPTSLPPSDVPLTLEQRAELGDDYSDAHADDLDDWGVPF